jgi:Na+/H+-translocating membrane pyrophosphatase
LAQKSVRGWGKRNCRFGNRNDFYFPTVLLFAAAIWTSYALAGFYGVALAASAMMATTAMQLAIDAFGPISDNAGGIAEMSELPKKYVLELIF